MGKGKRLPLSIYYVPVKKFEKDGRYLHWLQVPDSILSYPGLGTYFCLVYVFVVEEERAKRTEISLLAEASARAAIEGIEEGAQVIYPLPLDLRNNVKIAVLKTP